MQFFSNRRKQQDSNEQEAENDLFAEATPPFTTPAKQSIGFDTVLGAGSQTEGTLRSEGNIRLDGVFKGTLEILGNVLVGENAEIQADVEARNISIAGEVRGNVMGNRVQILSTGRIIGDINARTLTTEEGAHIDGKISMIEPPAAPPPPTPQPAPEILDTADPDTDESTEDEESDD